MSLVCLCSSLADGACGGGQEVGQAGHNTDIGDGLDLTEGFAEDLERSADQNLSSSHVRMSPAIGLVHIVANVRVTNKAKRLGQDGNVGLRHDEQVGTNRK